MFLKSGVKKETPNIDLHTYTTRNSYDLHLYNKSIRNNRKHVMMNITGIGKQELKSCRMA